MPSSRVCRSVPVTVFIGVLLVASPALAGTPVDVTDFAFEPQAVAIKYDQGVNWTFHGPTFHTVTDATGMGDYDSGALHAGETFTQQYDWAGTYPYRCTQHVGMNGSVRVGMGKPSVVSGKIWIGWGGVAPDGFVTDVQVKAPGKSWNFFVKGHDGISLAQYTPRGSGRYSFRARLRQTYGANPATGWSPPSRVRV